jgi:hypothetical protein
MTCGAFHSARALEQAVKSCIAATHTDSHH